MPSGFFCPGTPMASDAGLDVFTGQRDYDGGEEGAGGGRLQGREGGAAGADRLSDPEGAGAMSAPT